MTKDQLIVENKYVPHNKSVGMKNFNQIGGGWWRAQHNGRPYLYYTRMDKTDDTCFYLAYDITENTDERCEELYRLDDVLPYIHLHKPDPHFLIPIYQMATEEMKEHIKRLFPSIFHI